MVIVVMGVAGSGKSTVGQVLATSLGWPFCEGDAYHPEANTLKMGGGTALTEEDRAPWLAALRVVIAAALDAHEGLVVSCSALKQSHRGVLRVDPARVRLVYLKGDPEILRRRLRERQGHFMKEDMLESQLADLEEPAPAEALTLDVELPP